jgi:L-rhamnose mutarotase
MNRAAFKMKLLRGKAEEYRQRHNTIWPELKELLKAAGISNYSIYLDEETGFLLGILNIQDKLRLEELPNHPVMKKWWNFMKDIMETNADNSPVSIQLEEVFYLP